MCRLEYDRDLLFKNILNLLELRTIGFFQPKINNFIKIYSLDISAVVPDDRH